MRRLSVILAGLLIVSSIILNVQADSSLKLEGVELLTEGPDYLLVKAVVKNQHSSQWCNYRLWIRTSLNSAPGVQELVADRYASIRNGSEIVHWLTVPNDYDSTDDRVDWLQVELYELNGSDWSGVDETRVYLNLSKTQEETINQLLNSIEELQDSIYNLQIQLILLVFILGVSAAAITIFLLRKYWKVKHIPDSVIAEWADKRL